MNQSEQINELVTALAKAQAEISPALKESVNPFFKSKYADLSSIWTACKGPLTAHGLAIIQTMDYREGQTLLITTLAHASGQWMRSSVPIISVKQDAQSIGSAISHMRRYSLAAMISITTEDDDGTAACSPPKTTPLIISQAEAAELDGMLKACNDPGFADNIQAYLRAMKISHFGQLPRDKHDAVRRRLKEKLAEKQSEVKYA